MKKHLFGLLALFMLLALSACSSGSSSSDDDADTIPNGYYVYTEGGEASAYIRVNGSYATSYQAVGGSWIDFGTLSYTLSGNKIIAGGNELGTYNSDSQTIYINGNFVYSATEPTPGSGQFIQQVER